MRFRRQSAIWCELLIVLLIGAARQVRGLTEKEKLPVVRWDESHPGCTFARTDDGKYRYGLSTEGVGVTVAVDSQELEKVHRRHEPFFSVWLSIRNRGNGSLEFAVNEISLEFIDHFKVIQMALDPGEFSAHIQQDADNVDHQTAREVEKHPERKTAKEAYARAFQKESAELAEFVSNKSLRATHLDAGNQEAAGWVLFSTKSRWIGGWKKRENFVLRVPLAGKVFEFPFTLPPQAGELILRKRQ